MVHNLPPPPLPPKKIPQLINNIHRLLKYQIPWFHDHHFLFEFDQLEQLLRKVIDS